MTTMQQLLKLIVSLGERRPASTQPAVLDRLFTRLIEEQPSVDSDTEATIWEVWASHPDKSIERRLALATRSIAREEFVRARRMLDPLVEDYPQWAEAWSRRATLAYLEGRDAEAFEDVRRALELEPRHFGAVCSFAQICLRRGDRAAALTAFETALAINPQLGGVRAAITDLRESMAASLH